MDPHNDDKMASAEEIEEEEEEDERNTRQRLVFAREKMAAKWRQNGGKVATVQLYKNNNNQAFN